MPHEFYTSEDFTNEEYEFSNVIAKMVIDGGLQICKKCGAAEIELEQYETCEAFHNRPHGELHNWRREKLNPALRSKVEYYTGQVYNDRKGRFYDGQWIHTSHIISGPDEDGIVKTSNSVYKLTGDERSSTI